MNDFQSLNKLLSMPNFEVNNFQALLQCGSRLVDLLERSVTATQDSISSNNNSNNSSSNSSNSNSNSGSVSVKGGDKCLLSSSILSNKENSSNLPDFRPLAAVKPPVPSTSFRSVYGNVNISGIVAKAGGATAPSSSINTSSHNNNSNISNSSNSNSNSNSSNASALEVSASLSNLKSEEMSHLLSSLRAQLPSELEVILCKLLKIILCSQENRLKLGKYGVISIISVLKRQLDRRGVISSEVFGALLNACYEPLNVKLFIEEKGLEYVLQLLYTARDVNLMVKILGSLQSICHVPIGRQRMLLETDSIRLILVLMKSDDSLVRSRASGIIHNLSIDTHAIKVIRELDGVQVMIDCLNDCSAEVNRAVAGTIQNLSRETFSRSLLLEQEALVIQLLTDLVVSNDVDCQVVSMGAILNLLSPSLDEEGKSKLREALADGIALGAIRSSIFD